MPRKILFITDKKEQQYVDTLRKEWQKQGFEMVVAERGAAFADNSLAQYNLVTLVVDEKSPDSFSNQFRILREIANSPLVLMPCVELNQERATNAYYAGADQIIRYNADPAYVVAICLSQICRYNELKNRRVTPVNTFVGHRIYLDTYRYSVFVGGIEIELHKKEFAILKYLMEHAGRIMTYEQIICEVWGEEYVDDSKEALWKQVHSLREKIQIDPSLPQYIHTKRGIGYSFNVSAK